MNKKNKRHREDGPAYIEDDYKKWYLNGECHRVQGPAIDTVLYQRWYLNNNIIEPNNYKHMKIKKLIYIC